MANPGNEHPIRITAALIRALNHPVRREALRLLHRVPDEGMSGSQMSRVMTESVQSDNNNLRVLRKAHAIAISHVLPVSNVKEHKYESLVSSSPTVITLLADTETEDAWVRCD